MLDKMNLNPQNSNRLSVLLLTITALLISPILTSQNAQCPINGEDVDLGFYQDFTSRVSCRPEYLHVSYFPYVVTSTHLSEDGAVESYILEYCNSDQKHWVSSKSEIVQKLNMTVAYMTDDVVDIKLTTPEGDRWEIPHQEPFPHFVGQAISTKSKNALEVTVTSSPFSFTVKRKSTGVVIFDTTGYDFIYSDNYIQLTTKLPSSNIFGLGERAYNFDLGRGGTYTLFNKDAPWLAENGSPGNNLYGHHPVYLQREKGNKYSTVYLRNSNAMNVQVSAEKTLSFYVTGGVLDFIFFAGDEKPETSLEQYHQYLGGWKLFPFWSFGFHQCRWGYKSADRLLEVVNNYNSYNLPLDVIWSDIDYMEHYEDFTVNMNFPAAKMEKIYNTGKRYVPIIDAGIARGPGSEFFKEGVQKNLYIKNREGSNLEGSVWPGSVHFPDFFHPQASEWWGKGLAQLSTKVKFNGIWLDMNEVSNFCGGQCNWRNQCNGPFDGIPYSPTKGDLHQMTIRMDSTHHAINNKTVYEYNVHPFFGHMEGKATHDYLNKQSELTFVLSRSTAPGSGKYVAHWLGDNDSTWQWLKLSIAGTMTFNLFGIPMTGADICGFGGPTTEELCARWMQLGTLYPFSRNHNHNDAPDQEPYVLGSTVLETSRIALKARYSLLKYYYTLFIEKKGKGTIFRPVFFEFPEDDTFFSFENSYTDTQFMLGKNLMATPVVSKGVTDIEPYFPQEDWFNFFTGYQVHSAADSGTTHSVYAPLASEIPLFIRGGTIVHKQRSDHVKRSDDLDNMYGLVVALKGDDQIKKAQGQIMSLNNFNDSNIIDKCQNKNCFMNVNVTFNTSESVYYSFNITFSADDESNIANLEEIGIYSVYLYGIEYSSISQQNITLNGEPLDGAKIEKFNDGYVLSMPDRVIKHGDIIQVELYNNLADNYMLYAAVAALGLTAILFTYKKLTAKRYYEFDGGNGDAGEATQENINNNRDEERGI